jgi:histidinol dehydrogenase
MQQILYPEQKDWSALFERPLQPIDALAHTVKQIFDDVIDLGDIALLNYTRKFDWSNAGSLTIPANDLAEASALVSQDLKEAIALAAKNVERFHAAQREVPTPVETMPGVICWRESRPIEKVGIYIPGGSAPLFSTVIMLAIPAKLAGCREVVLCTPPDQDGAIHPAILYAAQATGITSVFRIGGAQAIAAMTLGTHTVPRVDKIFGPGNQYVTAAKMYAQRYGMPIDLPAGPSEVLIIADETATPAFVAADLLSQAEHGPDSQVMLVSNCETVVASVFRELKDQLDQLPRKHIANEALNNSKGIVLKSLNDCISFSNGYAPEHLIIAAADAAEIAARVTNAGSVFVGHFSCESAGDYASGTNHTLPTGGYARSYSGVSLDSFLKKITFQSVSAKGLEGIGPTIELMAEAEGLIAHKNAVSVRLSRNNIFNDVKQSNKK